MKKQQISNFQFFAIFYSFLVSNDLIRGFYNKDLRIDVWIPTAFAILGSLSIFFIYTFIYKNNNNTDFITSIENIVGKFFSKILFIFYTIYFIFMLFLHLRDISELINVFYLDTMVIFIIGAIFLLLILYIIFHGIEPFARYSSFIFYSTLIFFLSFSTLIFVFNQIKLDNMFPLLENGIKPLIKPALKMSYSIPMGELFVMMIIFQFVKNKKTSYKSGYFAILAGGFLLLNVTMFSIIFLNKEVIASGLNPSMNLWRRVDNDEFIQRFDLIVLGILILHVVVKLSVYVFASKHLLNKIIKVKKENLITIIICVMLIIALMYYGKDYTSIVLFRFNFVIPYINLTFEILIPFLIVILSFIKRFKLTFKDSSDD